MEQPSAAATTVGSVSKEGPSNGSLEVPPEGSRCCCWLRRAASPSGPTPQVVPSEMEAPLAARPSCSEAAEFRSSRPERTTAAPAAASAEGHHSHGMPDEGPHPVTRPASGRGDTRCRCRLRHGGSSSAGTHCTARAPDSVEVWQNALLPQWVSHASVWARAASCHSSPASCPPSPSRGGADRSSEKVRLLALEKEELLAAPEKVRS